MKRLITAIATLLLVVIPLTAGAAKAPKPVIEDPQGDGNFINDQGTGDGSFGDVTEVPGPSTVGDILEVSLYNDKKNLYVAVRTVAGPPATQGVGYRVRVNPDGPGGVYCLNFEMFFPGGTNNLTEFLGHLNDTCSAETIEAEVAPGLYGTTLTIPRSAHEAFGKGKTLTAPQAQAFVWTGTYPQGIAGPYMDTTVPGSDFKLKK